MNERYLPIGRVARWAVIAASLGATYGALPADDET